MTIRKALIDLINFVKPYKLETGYCMCGAAMSEHGVTSNHMPVDEGTYHHDRLIKEAETQLAIGDDIESIAVRIWKADRPDLPRTAETFSRETHAARTYWQRLARASLGEIV